MNVFIILVINLAYIIRVLSQEGAINLKRDLFSNYDSQSRPVENQSQIMKICAGLYILQIVGLSEKSQVILFSLSFFLLIFSLNKIILLFICDIDYASKYSIGIYMGN
jgi:hypothetical protein